MCMITVVPAGIDIPVKGIMNGGTTNDDGHGWAVASRTELLTGKSMDLGIAIRGFIDARDTAGPSSIGMFHSRWGTHGIMGEFNVHPFEVTDHSVVAHNGILPGQYLPEAGDKRSDTRIFVDRVARGAVDRRSGLPSRRSSRRLAEMIGNGNKLAFLAVTPRGPKVRLVNAWAGVFTDGVWYSNSGYKPSMWEGYSARHAQGGTYIYSWQREDPDDGSAEDCVNRLGYPSESRWTRSSLLEGLCPECYSDDISEKLRYCRDCQACVDCGFQLAECICHREHMFPVRSENTYDKDTPWWDEQYSKTKTPF